MIGVAILSTDRGECLDRLLKSMYEFSTESVRRCVSISVYDDSTSPEAVSNVTKKYSGVKFIHTGERLGVAKNTNFALEGLKEYDYSMLFNNDCEILKEGWHDFYYQAFLKTKIHHFCFRQNGLWGAGTDLRPHTDQVVNGVIIRTIHNFPQGALLAFSKKAFETVGYFDSDKFISYGRSHWMWSFSISESGIQLPGIHDIVGSNSYFKVHNEPSVTPSQERREFYYKNTIIFEEELNKLKCKKRPIYTPIGKNNANA